MSRPTSKTVRKPIAVLVIATGVLVSVLGITGAIIAKNTDSLGWLIGAGILIAAGCYAYYRRSREEARLADESRTSRSSQRAT